MCVSVFVYVCAYTHTLWMGTYRWICVYTSVCVKYIPGHSPYYYIFSVSLPRPTVFHCFLIAAASLTKRNRNTWESEGLCVSEQS